MHPYYKLFYEYENYLAHHGIQGMKWGVQNGPPYPLGNDAYNAIQGSGSSLANAIGNKTKESSNNLKIIDIYSDTGDTPTKSQKAFAESKMNEVKQLHEKMLEKDAIIKECISMIENAKNESDSNKAEARYEEALDKFETFLSDKTSASSYGSGTDDNGTFNTFTFYDDSGLISTTYIFSVYPDTGEVLCEIDEW